jgi:hypothetical protein
MHWGIGSDFTARIFRERRTWYSVRGARSSSSTGASGMATHAVAAHASQRRIPIIGSRKSTAIVSEMKLRTEN